MHTEAAIIEGIALDTAAGVIEDIVPVDIEAVVIKGTVADTVAVDIEAAVIVKQFKQCILKIEVITFIAYKRPLEFTFAQ